jgi:hypothetical protein
LCSKWSCLKSRESFIRADLLPRRGLEPLTLAGPDPKSGASANFATSAWDNANNASSTNNAGNADNANNGDNVNVEANVLSLLALLAPSALTAISVTLGIFYLILSQGRESS